MRDSDWSREIVLRSDWLHSKVALYTTRDIELFVMFFRLLQLRNFELLPIALPFVGLIVILMHCCIFYLEVHFKTITRIFIVV